MRSRAPSLHSAMTTRLRAACSAMACCVTASNTLRPGSLRSAAKLRPALVPVSITGPWPCGPANGVSRASGASASRSRHCGSDR